jgi:ribosomal protein S18 acetylase RimI-like enzyme
MTAIDGTSTNLVVQLRGREDQPAVAELFALAQIHRDPVDADERGPLIAREYAASKELRLYGYDVDGSVMGLIGIERTGEQRATIRDLAVAPDGRLRGIGRALIDHLRHRLGFTELDGETLEPAIAFYERCGFSVGEDGSMPDGRTRYRFSWNADRRP